MNYQYNLRYAEILYSQALATQSNITLLETSRKYFAHSLVLIDNKQEKRIGNNVARALWGLIKVCKTIASGQKEDLKNDQMLELAQNRVRNIYSKQTDLDVNKMSVMN